MTLHEFKTKHKITTQKTLDVLLECYRRITVFRKTIDYPMVYLGFPSEVKGIEYLEPYSNELKRCLNWYNLTNSGKEVMKDLLKVKLEINGFECNEPYTMD